MITGTCLAKALDGTVLSSEKVFGELPHDIYVAGRNFLCYVQEYINPRANCFSVINQVTMQDDDGYVEQQVGDFLVKKDERMEVRIPLHMADKTDIVLVGKENIPCVLTRC